MIDYVKIGQRIQSARTTLGLTQEALAEGVQVSRNYISQVETGKERPNLELLGKISVAVDISLPALLTDVVEERHYLHSDIAEVLASCSPEKTRLIYDLIVRVAQYSE